MVESSSHVAMIGCIGLLLRLIDYSDSLFYPWLECQVGLGI